MLDIFKEIRKDLRAVEDELQQVVQHHHPLLNETSSHLLNAGGKRLRPAFALLSGKFYNYQLEKVLPLAVALELLHMASLVHDDVVDSAATRRGIPTVKAKWGNRISMHTGDLIFAKALVLISKYEDTPLITKVLSQISVKMCEGEIQQLSSAYQINQSIKDYLYRVQRKTALLIAASCQLGAVACGAPKEIYMPLRRYGHKIGIAFQIIDDILDMVADQQKLGKTLGADLRQGIITLPMLYALKNSPRKERLAQLISKESKTEEEVFEAIDIIKECGSIEYSNLVVDRYISGAKKELDLLPDVQAKNTLLVIADFVKHRKF
ncbi:polyprenyl synthetase family protein [Desulfofalx alkaliphila]|uniref:polyprenyl synthetase family protein n=1 Tax=Desulfofalx alkaliphila TaxID=105483 RepID=UPI0004E0E19B|nr:polyprenyl synthetase family protein [Desulfofalx alkaliphila]